MTTPDPRFLNAINVLEEEARAVAQCFGVTSCEAVAAALVDRFLMRLGGTYVYIPQRRVRERARIHEEIARRSNGQNVKELAREYSMSPRHVRRIAANYEPVSMAAKRTG